jgi:hypothetical protein
VAWTANAVLPIPAIPPIAWMLTTPPDCAALAGRVHKFLQLVLAPGERGNVAGQRQRVGQPPDRVPLG